METESCKPTFTFELIMQTLFIFVILGTNSFIFTQNCPEVCNCFPIYISRISWKFFSGNSACHKTQKTGLFNTIRKFSEENSARKQTDISETWAFGMKQLRFETVLAAGYGVNLCRGNLEQKSNPN